MGLCPSIHIALASVTITRRERQESPSLSPQLSWEAEAGGLA